MTINVLGTPAPQGSKRHLGHGIMVESSKAVKPWREAVKWACIHAGGAKIEGPVSVDVAFFLAKPKSVKLGERPWKKPDIDKLLRSTFDGLGEAGVFEDDSRIVRVQASKVYAINRAPGALIIIERI